MMSSSPSDDGVKSLWSERVEYVDLSSTQTEPSPTARPLPLFLLGGAFYPQGQTVLQVFEMKYRTMMFDCANSDDMFGYMHTDLSGRIASIGTLCKITSRQLEDDGRQIIAVEGVSRFRINKILKTLPYVLAEIDGIDDVPPTDDVVAAKLENEVYDMLKYYIRLVRAAGPNKLLAISHACKKSRPTLAGTMADQQANAQRRTKFSFALASMIQMQQSKESQLLLQTTNVVQRLRAEKDILQQATEAVADMMLGSGDLTAELRDSIKFSTFSGADDDADILPPDIVEEETEEVADEWDLSNIT